MRRVIALVVLVGTTGGTSLQQMSPWAASQLKVPHVRGSDIEELRPHSLIAALAEANPQSTALKSMVELTKAGYKRALAPKLLDLARGLGVVKDSTGQPSSGRSSRTWTAGHRAVPRLSCAAGTAGQ